MARHGFFGTDKQRNAFRKTIKTKTRQEITEATAKHDAEQKLAQLAAFIKKPDNQPLLTPTANGELDFRTVGHFNAKNTKDQTVLQLAINNFTQKQETLRSLDLKITFSFLGGILGMTLGAVFGPLAWLGAASFTYSGYCYGVRQKAYEDYQQSLNDLCNVYTWCFNDKQAKITKSGDKLSIGAITDNEAFQTLDDNVAELVCTINPVLNDDDLKALTRNDIDDPFKLERDTAQKKSGAGQFDITIEYLMYGRGQGSIKQVAWGILSMIGQMCSSLFSASSPRTPEAAGLAKR